jgi:uncharacterized protein (DUF1499 family)
VVDWTRTDTQESAMAHDSFAASRTPPPAEQTAPGRGGRVATAIAWISVVLALLGGVAELMGGVGYRLHWWGVGAGIRTLGIGAIGAAAAFVIAISALFIAWLGGARRAMAIAAAGLLLGALLAAPPFTMWRRATTVPPIHDISTDTLHPPSFAKVMPLRAGAPNAVDYSAAVAAQQKAAYPDIGPLMLPQSPARAFDLADRAARAMGWDIVNVSPPDLRIEATATTRLFGFQDDVVVRITPESKGSRVDVRSVSRVGRSDIGTNAERIREYLKQLADLARTEG